MISCKKATLLLTIREDRALTRAERFGLSLHLGVCSLCRNYLSQTNLITKMMARSVVSHDQYKSTVEKISDEKKTAIKKLLNKQK